MSYFFKIVSTVLKIDLTIFQLVDNFFLIRTGKVLFQKGHAFEVELRSHKNTHILATKKSTFNSTFNS